MPERDHHRETREQEPSEQKVTLSGARVLLEIYPATRYAEGPPRNVLQRLVRQIPEPHFPIELDLRNIPLGFEIVPGKRGALHYKGQLVDDGEWRIGGKPNEYQLTKSWCLRHPDFLLYPFEFSCEVVISPIRIK